MKTVWRPFVDHTTAERPDKGAVTRGGDASSARVGGAWPFTTIRLPRSGCRRLSDHLAKLLDVGSKAVHVAAVDTDANPYLRCRERLPEPAGTFRLHAGTGQH